MTRRRHTLLGATIALAALALAGSTSAGAMPPGPPTRSASAMASFAGTTFDRAAGEAVDLDGTLHVVTQLSGTEASGWTLEWHVNVDRATGTGETSGDDYVLDGADAGTIALPPGPPVRTAQLEPTFALMPPGPPTHPPSPCRFLVVVSFDDAGAVTGVDAHLAESPPPNQD